MENKELNIAEILKDKPKDTKLWSDTFGNVTLKDVTISKSGGYPIFLTTNINDEALYLDIFGRYYKNVDGVRPCIVPSKKMRDWEKFAWKRGDVIVNTINDISCIFDGWRDDEYETFAAKFIYSSKTLDDEYETFAATKFISSSKTWEDVSWFYTNNFAKSSDSEAFINMIEEQYGGKLNLETLEIEEKPEFKDGDILTFCGFIFIFKNIDDSMVYSHASYDTDNKDCIRLNADMPFCINSFIADFKYATREEKQRLFDALAKEGKQWDAEKKAVVDLPKEEKKCEFNPMDWCLMRVYYSAWNLCLYAYYRKDIDMFVSVGGNTWKECIPYNDQTKHLLGTSDDCEGGE